MRETPERPESLAPSDAAPAPGPAVTPDGPAAEPPIVEALQGEAGPPKPEEPPNEDETAAPATLVPVPQPGQPARRWLNVGAGLGAITLLAIVGWVVVDRDTPATATAEATPPGASGTTPPVPATAPPGKTAETGVAPPPTPAPPGPGTTGDPPPGRSEGTPPPPTPPEAGTPRTADATPQREEEPEKPEPMDRYEATVRIERGDTLESLLRDMDFTPDDIRKASTALRPVLKGARLPVGETITLQVQTPPQADGKPTLQALVIRPEARREITLERGADGNYTARQRTFDVVPKLVRATGVVRGSLRGSADAAGIPPPVLAEMLRAFSWDVNFQYDVKGGDRFAVLIEQSYTTDGRLVSPGRVLWAQLTTGGGKSTFNVYRFKPDRGAEFFYYANGQSVVKSLLRTPMNVSRISSRYGMREHPIMGFTSMHSGVDFAAPYGTPILAAGAGTVVQASRYGGYGNWVKIDHGGGVATGYAHMARYAPGIRPGVRVRQGQVVGFVGSTGMSTGPHLHYELHQKGRPVNPLSARVTQRASLGGKDLARFKAAVHQTDRARDGAEQIAAR